MSRKEPAPGKLLSNEERQIILRNRVRELGEDTQLKVFTLSDYNANLYEDLDKSLRRFLYGLLFSFFILLAPIAVAGCKHNKLEQIIVAVGQRMAAQTRLLYLQIDETGMVHEKSDFFT